MVLKLFLILLLVSIQPLFSQEKKSFSNQQLKDSLIKIGIQGYFNKDTLLIKKVNSSLLNLYSSTNDSTLLAKYYHYKALLHRVQYATDSSFYYYHLSKNISIKIKDSLEVGRRLLSMAVMQREVKDYLGSEVTSIEGLQYLEPISSYEYIKIFGSTTNLMEFIKFVKKR